MGSHADSAALPNRLTELRQAAGLTMIEVAGHCNVSRESVRRWERRIYPIPDDQKPRLAALLSVRLGREVKVGQLMGCRCDDCGWGAQ